MAWQRLRRLDRATGAQTRSAEDYSTTDTIWKQDAGDRIYFQDVVLTVEQNMLQAALVSWGVTRVMDALLVLATAETKTAWEKTMEHVTLVIKKAETLVVNTICSSVVVAGVCLEWLVHVARAVGIGVNRKHYKRNTPAGLIPYGQPLRHFHLMALSSAAPPLGSNPPEFRWWSGCSAGGGR